MFLKYSTATAVALGPFIDDTDGITPETGLAATMTVTLIFADGTSAARDSATSIVHRVSGYYSVPLSATDTANMGPLTVVATDTGALPVFGRFYVCGADFFNVTKDLAEFTVDVDSIQGDSTAGANLAAAFDGSTGYAFPNSSIDANVIEITGSTTAAGNFADDYDGTGYAHTNSQIDANVVSLGGDATAQARLRRAALSTLYEAIPSGTPTTTTFLSGLTGYATDALVDRYVVFLTGNIAMQVQQITAYNGTTGLITVGAAFSQAPAVADTFHIF